MAETRARVRPGAVAAIAVAAAALLTLYALADPAAEGSLFPRCVFHELTGWQCPGCGSQRALHALLGGRVADAWALNPLMVAAIPLLAALVAADLWPVRLRRLRRALYSPGAIWSLAGVVVTFMILRNLL